ncbi:peptide methionine sulfoxide reductase MsrA [Amylibacter marinus]|uniref:Peptide methionine sulfoxide reductase MsrA n=1 Tax=Amylibacter marinus TaxID=1475483 RepID=A0ABQ5VVM6_9RHOB|nr:peptide-methionine (S)-S-oxide reductase MsrA [Amylibacter marinus]GLQ35487.1 peptide methionine sulfoxide reductase MsrA [Amylibacter marinus]
MKKSIYILVTSILLGALPAQARQIETAVFAGGCFWCIESDFESVKGVKEVVSGYTGGSTKNPTYKTIADHYEAVEITYDADIVDYETLVNLFFRSVDPLDAGGQFCDRGKNYSTAIFAQTPQQSETATKVKAQIDASKVLRKKIVTPILGKFEFTNAEAFHQNYYKSSKRVVTRFGVVQKKDAYKRYRKGCGRDARVKQLWGDAAAFAH